MSHNNNDLPYELPPEVARRNNTTITELRAELDAGRLVIITGAGVTRNALTDADGNAPRYTAWDGLIENGLAYIEDTFSLDEEQKMYVNQAKENAAMKSLKGLLKAATTLKEELEERDHYATWLSSVFEPLKGEIKQPDIFDCIATLHKQGATLLTTNYDDLLDKRCGLKSLDASEPKRVVDFKSKKSGEYVFHVHGHYENPEVLVLTKQDYFVVQRREFPQSALVRDVLENALDFRTVLFMGVGDGVNDPNLNALLDWARERQKNRAHRHCVLLRNGDRPPNDFLRPIFYGRTFSDLGGFLKNFCGKALTDQSGPSPSMNAHAIDIDHERSKIHDWLDPLDQLDLHDRNLLEYTEGTGSWFLQNYFSDWLSKPSAVGWLNGSVGSGKSVITSVAIERTKERCMMTVNPPSRYSMAYYYFTAADKPSLLFSSMLKTLLAQLFTFGPTPACLRASYANCLRVNQSRPTTLQMREMLFCILTQPCLNHTRVSTDQNSIPCNDCSRVSSHTFAYLIFDGLDELRDNTQREPILQLLRDLIRLDLPHVHILVTSRDQPSISSAVLSSKRCTPVTMSIADVCADIEGFVASQIEHHDRLRELCQEHEGVRLEIFKRLVGTRPEDGMFRWASLQMKALKDLKPLTKPKVLNKLENMPKSLQATYESMLLSKEDYDLQQVLCVLKWIICATRSLFIEELIDSCIVTSDGVVAERPAVDPSLRLRSRDFLDLLEDLIVTRPPLLEYSATVPHRTHVVSLAHFSVEEYVTGQQILQGQAKAYFVGRMDAHRFIFRNCLAYLYCCNTFQSRHNYYPLRRYAWYNWDRHIMPDVGADLERSNAQRLLQKMISCFHSVGSRNKEVTEDIEEFKKFGLTASWFDQLQERQMVRALSEPFFFEDYDKYQPIQQPVGEQRQKRSPYFPLQTGEVRLLSILPMMPINPEGAMIKTKIEHALLDQEPRFDALSYAWDQERCDIFVQGHLITATKGLVEALKDFSLDQETKTHRLWIDQLSIDQVNFQEKIEQVMLMPRVFRGADNIRVVFGRLNGSAGESEGVAFLRYLAGILTTTSSASKAIGEPQLPCLQLSEAAKSWILSFFEHRWWRRVWVVQEMVLARNVTLTFGRHAISFDEIENLNSGGREWHKLAKPSQKGDTSMDWFIQRVLKSQGMVAALNMSQGRAALRHSQPLSLAQALHLFSFQESTHFSDKVYALLNIISPEESALIQVDYNQSTRTLMTSITRHLVIKTGSFDVLSWKSCYRENQTSSERNSWPAEFPSWVPNLYLKTDRVPLILASFGTPVEERLYSTGISQGGSANNTQRSARVSFGADNECMIAHGAPVGEIAATYEYPLSSFTPSQFSSLYFALNSDLRPPKDQNQHTHSEVELWRTLLADQKPEGGRLGSDIYEVKDAIIKGEPSSPGLKFTRGRQLIVTHDDRLGLAPDEARQGDSIIVLEGGNVPFVMRKVDRYYPEDSNHELVFYKLIGECYVEGIMDGESLAGLSKGQPDLRPLFNKLAIF